MGGCASMRVMMNMLYMLHSGVLRPIFSGVIDLKQSGQASGQLACPGLHACGH